MGQVPKNIIYAQSGTKLIIGLDGNDTEFDENDVDKIATSGIKALQESGEIKDASKMMEAYRNFKDLAKKGKYSFDTDKETGVVGMNYKGEATNAQLGLTDEGDVSKRSRFGRRMTNKLKNEESAYMARLHSIIGSGLNAKLTAKQEAEALAQRTAEAAAKAKAEAEETERKTKYGTTPDLKQAIADRIAGGNLAGLQEVWDATPEADRQKVLREVGEPIAAEWSKYDNVKHIPGTWMDPYKKEGALDFNNQQFITDLYTKAYGNFGKNIANQAYGIKSPEELEKAKQETEFQEREKAKEAQREKLELEATLSEMVDSPFGTKADKDFTVRGKIKYKNHMQLQPDGTYKYLFELANEDGTTTLYEAADDSGDYLVSVNGPRKVIKHPASQVATKKEGGVIVMQSGGKAAWEKFKKLPADAPVNTTKVDPAETSSAPTTEESGPKFTEKKAESAQEVKKAVTKGTTAQKSIPEFIRARSGEKAKEKPAEAILDQDVRDLQMNKITTADRLDLSALVLDLGSLGATFVPGYGNAVGAVAGLGSTGMGLAAQAQRGELNWRDWGSAGINTALDLATLVPGAGTIAKSTKIVRNLDKLKNVFMLAGAGSAVIASIDAFKNDKYTMNDIHTIVNAARGVLGATKKANFMKDVLVEGPIETPRGVTLAHAKNLKTGNIERNVAVTYDHNDGKWKPVTNPENYQVTRKKDFWFSGKKGLAREISAATGKTDLSTVYTRPPSGGVNEEGILISPLSRQAMVDRAIAKAQSKGVKQDPFTAERKAADMKRLQEGEADKAKKTAEKVTKKTRSKKKAEPAEEGSTPTNKNGGIIKALIGVKIPDYLKKATYAEQVGAATDMTPFQKKLTVAKELAGTPFGQTLKANLITNTDIFGNQRTINQSVDPGKEAGVYGNEGGKGILQKPLFKNMDSEDKYNAIELFRTLRLNDTVKNLDLAVEAPLATPAARVPGRTGGDLLTKTAMFNQAAETRQRYGKPVSSDATFNLMQRLSGEEIANKQELQGIGVDAEARRRNEVANLEADRQYATADAALAASNQSSLANATQRQRELENARKSQLASNMDTFISSTALRGATREAERQKLYNSIDYEQALNNLRSSKKYVDMFRNLKIAGSDVTKMTPELEQQQNEYMRDVANLKKGLATGKFSFKKGGSFRDLDYERELSRYKEVTSHSRGLIKIYNRWIEKQGDSAQHISEEFSKRMLSTLDKIHK